MKAYLFSFLTSGYGKDTKSKKQYVLIYAETAGDAMRTINRRFQFVDGSIKNLTFE